MKTVLVKACNLNAGDVIVGKKNQRIIAKHLYTRRVKEGSQDKDATKGVLVIAPNPNGYKLDTFHFAGHKKVKVKRPITNMKYRRKK